MIEDDRAISELLCMNLNAAGYETAAAYDGEEARRLLLWHEDADLALVDIMLPGKDGFSLMDDFNEKMNESPEYKDELHEMIDEQLRATVKQNRKNYEKEICDENNMRDYSSYELSESIIKDMIARFKKKD